MKAGIISNIVFLLIVANLRWAHAAETHVPLEPPQGDADVAALPAFSQFWWQSEVDKARSKSIRGAGLVLLGLGAMVPTIMLIDRAVDDPRGDTGFAMMASLATGSALLHGIMSVGFGNEQQRSAQWFADMYENTPAGPARRQEMAFHLYTRRKSTRKMIVFGAVCVAEGLIALTSGVLRSVWRASGAAYGDSAIWPAWVVAGVLLPAGVFVIASGSRRLQLLQAIETDDRSASISAISIAPFFYRDPLSERVQMGVGGRFRF